MAGIYVHIPFCKKACHYCNFHFSTSLKRKEEMLSAILTELNLRRNYLNTTQIDSIYLGGGTPSVLTIKELDNLFTQINNIFTVAPDAEITLEANPDDLSSEYLSDLKNSGLVNRLSIGVQSFYEDDLLFMNRAHNAIEAKACIEYAQDIGFENLTIDLIYGTPTLTDKHWLKNLKTAFKYDIPHISCYALTVEPQTALEKRIEKGKSAPVDEEKTARHFEMLMDMMAHYGYLHYEISNFAQPDHFAKHNSNYWLGVPYLGIGPSAHSFDGESRQSTVSNNAHYIKSLAQNVVPFSREELTLTQRYNEYVMTSLRTIWGCDPSVVESKFGKIYLKYFNQKILQFIQNETVMTDGKIYRLTNKGRLLADRIAMILFFED